MKIFQVFMEIARKSILCLQYDILYAGIEATEVCKKYVLRTGVNLSARSCHESLIVCT
jgi:hypothetical protein